MYDGYMTFNGVELFNVARTATLAEVLGIDSVWVTSESVDWVRQKLGDSNYSNVTSAPWQENLTPESSEFAGILPLGIAGGSDSSWSSTPIEFITDGGVPGRARFGTQDLVFSAAIVASTDRGAAFGLQWLNKVLIADGNQSHHAGYSLRYWRSEALDAPLVYRLNVKMTRGTSVTRKRNSDCSSVWLVTFTLNSANPHEYGEPVDSVSALGVSSTATGPGVISSGTLTYGLPTPLTYNYDPVYDPETPALIAPPTSVGAYPANWPFTPGLTMTRWWARIRGVPPTQMPLVPIIGVGAPGGEMRGLRVSIWDFDGASSVSETQNFDFSASISYLPSSAAMTMDGRREAIAVGNTMETSRRADSLVYSRVGGPLEWTTLRPTHPSGEMVFAVDRVHTTSGNPWCSLSLVPLYE